MISRRATLSDLSGFTLAELLVASTMIAIVLASTYTAFSSAIRVWRSGEEGQKRYHEGRIALDLISNELQAVPATAFHLFEGREDDLLFYTVASPVHAEDGRGARLIRVRYRLTDGPVNQLRTLVREEALVLGPLPKPARTEDAIDHTRVKLGTERRFELASKVSRFGLRYIWVPPIDGNPQGLPEDVPLFFRDETLRKLPQGVEISLSLAPEASGGETLHLTGYVTYRGPTSRFPREWLEEARRRTP